VKARFRTASGSDRIKKVRVFITSAAEFDLQVLLDPVATARGSDRTKLRFALFNFHFSI
jgi:hypothetical protein